MSMDRLVAFVAALLLVVLCVALTSQALHRLDQTRQQITDRIAQSRVTQP